MASKPFHLAVAVMGLAFFATAHAYQFNSIGRHYNINWVYGKKSLAEKVSRPVHESMTLIAFGCKDAVANCAGQPVVFPAPMPSYLRNLLAGVEWNDDPSLKLGDPKTERDWGRFLYDGGKLAYCHNHQSGKCKGIDDKMDLLYRSHYGDLQFLHSMASSRYEKPEDTLAKVITWAEFTYKVASGEILPHTDLTTLKKIGVSKIDDYLKRGSWTPSYLFTRNTHSDAKDVRLVALGSLLHTVQDSYSDSHVARENSCNPAHHNKLVIFEFYDYSQQDSILHGEADTLPEWLEKDQLNDANPVAASARLLKLWADGAQWTDVEPVLRNDLFKLGNPLRNPSAGDPKCYAPKAAQL